MENLLKEEYDKQQGKLKELIKAYKFTFDTLNGKKVLEDLIKISALNVPTGYMEGEKLNYIKGAQDIVLRIKNFVESKDD